MIALGIRYLCGWAAATDPASYEEPEWPPHPARVFMALAAAHFETRDAESPDDQAVERAALEWLEAAGPPALRASGYEVREPVTTFVPVNDPAISSRVKPGEASHKAVKSALTVLPGRRSRQPRTFPRAIPHEDTVWLLWFEGDPPSNLRDGLSRLCGKVARVGHSSSMVQMWLADANEEVRPNLFADAETPQQRLRIPASGLLADLEAAYSAGVRPTVGLWAEYGEARHNDSVVGSHFDPRLLVLRLRPGPENPDRSLGLASTALLTDYFRRAVISATPEPVPESLSGHQPDGSPSRRIHAAFFPLGFVGHRHAGGQVLGMAVALPREIPVAERRICEAALAALSSAPDDRDDSGGLVMGSLGRWRLEPLGAEPPPYTLRSETWTKPASIWASATPVVLDRFTHDEDEKGSIIADACERIGLPRPAEVRMSHVSALRGAPPSPEFGPLPRSDERPTRPFIHVVVRFGDQTREPQRLSGPVLLGAGRYRGYGLLRPLRAGRSR